MIELHRHGDAGEYAELRIQAEKDTNPLNMAMLRQAIGHLRDLEEDDTARGAILWGGPARSFSVGGDFRELRELSEDQEIQDYLTETTTSLLGLLAFTKPLIVAVDHYAIGLGLQVALMADWRVGTERSSYHMPELKHGVACPIGSTMLEFLFGRAQMTNLVIGCHGLTASEAHRVGLVSERVPDDELWSAAMARLELLAAYPPQPFRMTKEFHNRRFDDVLRAAIPDITRIHSACVRAGSPKAHFKKVLGTDE